MSIVFAAGFLVPQQFGRLEYFRGAAAAFPGALFPPVPPLADIAARANDLANHIAAAFPAGPIHILAHSMGGLDSRYLLSKNLQGLATRVKSLSMMSTPNQGSPIADFLVGPAPSPLDPRWITYQTIVHLAAELNLSVAALGNLTSAFAKTFNPQNPNVPGANYFSYAASGMESFVLKPAHVYIDFTGHTPTQKSNDGLVTVESASWVPLAEPPWATADHLSEVGYNLSSPTLRSAFDHLGAYHRILARAGA